MTEEDLNQIRQIVADSEARTIEVITRTANALTVKQDHAVESIGGEFSELRAEMTRRFEEVDRRFEGLDRRMERINEGMRAVEIRMAALSKWADTLDRDNTAMNSSQAAQQRAIDQLNARVDAHRTPATPRGTALRNRAKITSASAGLPTRHARVFPVEFRNHRYVAIADAGDRLDPGSRSTPK